MAETTHIIKYLSDLNNLKTQLKEVENINKLIAQQMGKDFVKATEVIKRQLDSIAVKPVKIKVEGADGKISSKETTGTISQISTFAKTAQGDVIRLTETLQQTKEQGIKPLGQSIKVLDQSFGSVSGKISQTVKPLASLSTEFNNVNKVNKNLSKEFGSNFSKIASIVEKNTNKIKQAYTTIEGQKVATPIQTLGAVVKTTDGNFAQLTKTITTLPDKTTKVSYAMNTLANYASKAGNSIKQDLSGIDFTKNLDLIKSTGIKNITDQLGSGFKVLGQTVKSVDFKTFNDGATKVTKPVVTLSSTVQDAEGKIGTFTQKLSASKDGLSLVGTSFKDSTTAMTRFGDNLTKLAGRALLTIPTWFLLRNAIQAPIKFLKTGISGIVSFDTALQKAKRNLQGTSAEIGTNFEKLRKEATRLALETGVSTDKIINSFQKFATVGFNFEDSLRGATDSVKLSILLFGDAEETANAFSRALRVLVDTSKGAVPVQEQIGDAIALTSELWKQNQFDINEVNSSLTTFASTAKTTNLSIKETLTLLATLGTGALGGAKGGTLLRTSIQKLIENLDKLAPTLGVKVNPQLDTTFEVLTRVLDAVEKLSKTSKLAPEATLAIADIFGGIRGGQPVRVLVALNEELKKNIKLTSSYGQFTNEVEDLNKEITRQVEITKTLSIENGKAFITGLAGAEDFKSAIIGINDALKGVVNFSKSFGKALRITLDTNFRQEGYEKAQQGFFDNIYNKITNQPPVVVEPEILIKGFKNNLSKSDLGKLIIDIKENKINVSKDVKPRVLAVLENNLKKLEAVANPNVSVQANNVTISFEEQQNVAKLILEERLKTLKAEGANESIILKQTGYLIKQLGIEETIEDKLRRKFELEKSISEEKRLQGKLSSDDIKLYDIAKENGVKTAKAIGDVLAGNTDFETFVKIGGEQLDVFKEKFADIFKQKQAEQFFKGNIVSGESPLLRGGSSIAIESNAIRQPNASIFDSTASLMKSKLESELLKLKVIPTQKVSSMTVGAISFPSGTLNKDNLISNTGIRSTIDPNQKALYDAILTFYKDQQSKQEDKTAPIVNNTFNITDDNPEEIAQKTLEKLNKALVNKQSETGKAFIKALEDY